MTMKMAERSSGLARTQHGVTESLSLQWKQIPTTFVCRRAVMYTQGGFCEAQSNINSSTQRHVKQSIQSFTPLQGI